MTHQNHLLVVASLLALLLSGAAQAQKRMPVRTQEIPDTESGRPAASAEHPTFKGRLLIYGPQSLPVTPPPEHVTPPSQEEAKAASPPEPAPAPVAAPAPPPVVTPVAPVPPPVAVPIPAPAPPPTPVAAPKPAPAPPPPVQVAAPEPKPAPPPVQVVAPERTPAPPPEPAAIPVAAPAPAPVPPPVAVPIPAPAPPPTRVAAPKPAPAPPPTPVAAPKPAPAPPPPVQVAAPEPKPAPPVQVVTPEPKPAPPPAPAVVAAPSVREPVVRIEPPKPAPPARPRQDVALAAPSSSAVPTPDAPVAIEPKVIESIFTCLAPGLPQDWKRAWVEITDQGAGKEKASRFRFSNLRGDDDGEPLVPCNGPELTRRILSLNEKLAPDRRTWTRALLVIDSDGEYELSYEYPK